MSDGPRACICRLPESTRADSRVPHVQPPESAKPIPRRRHSLLGAECGDANSGRRPHRGTIRAGYCAISVGYWKISVGYWRTGGIADIADMLTLISKSNTKKIKKGILAIYPFLINLWKLMSACQQCQRLEDFRMAHLVDFRLQMLVHWGTVRSVIHSYRRKTSQRASVPL